jgi:hypothetical protein
MISAKSRFSFREWSHRLIVPTCKYKCDYTMIDTSNPAQCLYRESICEVPCKRLMRKNIKVISILQLKF